MTQGESRYAKRLIAAILDRRCTISVHDGEAWPLVKATNATAIFKALASTDMDTLRVREHDGLTSGSFMLVYGNAPDGSELVADHTDNPLCNAIWQEVFGGPR